mgnify:CR=1 FL=1|tara:strand:- start:39910 stop:42474 length:2565 start_codon:yes stop_codon:yes gene_type:complete
MTLSTWIEQIDNYQQSGEKARDISHINNLIAPDSPGRKELHKNTHDGNKNAREKFLTYLHNEILNNKDNNATNPKPIDIRELLGDTGLELYQAALNEESRSKNFRDAVFVNSTNHYDGIKWSKKLVLWVGGPSAAGKSFGAEAIIDKVEHQIPKDMSTAKQKKDEHGKTIMSESGVAEMEYDESGNDVVSIDGGIEREIFQMRQMLLQVALVKGYTGVDKLDAGDRKFGIKEIVQKATEKTDDLSMVLPNTFVKAYAISDTIGSDTASRFSGTSAKMKSFERDNNVAQFFSIVEGEPGKEQQFRDTVYHSGTTRAWYKGEKPNAADIKMNNTNIGCESKVYDPKPFDRGVSSSRRGMDMFRLYCHNPDNQIITFTTDLVHIYSPQDDGKWEICPRNEEPTHKMSKRDLESFLLFLNNRDIWEQKSEIHKQISLSEKFKGVEASNINPDDWLKACRKGGISARPIIQTQAELKEYNNFQEFLHNPTVWAKKNEAYKWVVIKNFANEMTIDQNNKTIAENERRLQTTDISSEEREKLIVENQTLRDTNKKLDLTNIDNWRIVYKQTRAKTQAMPIRRTTSSDHNKGIDKPIIKEQRQRSQSFSGQPSQIETNIEPDSTIDSKTDNVAKQVLFNTYRQPPPKNQADTQEVSETEDLMIASTNSDKPTNSSQNTTDESRQLRQIQQTPSSLPTRPLTPQRDIHEAKNNLPKYYSLTTIQEAAKSELEANGKVKEIQSFPIESNDIQSITISFECGENTLVKTYVEDVGDDKIQFSIEKSAMKEEQDIAIIEMCNLAVKAADKDTVFNIPESLDFEKRKLVSAAFENAIQNAINDGRFKEGFCPTVQGANGPRQKLGLN